MLQLRFDTPGDYLMHQPMQGARAHVPRAADSSLISVSELADYLQLTDETVRRLARRGNIPSVTVARRVRFDLAAVLKTLEGEQ